MGPRLVRGGDGAASDRARASGRGRRGTSRRHVAGRSVGPGGLEEAGPPARGHLSISQGRAGLAPVGPVSSPPAAWHENGPDRIASEASCDAAGWTASRHSSVYHIQSAMLDLDTGLGNLI